MSTVQIKYKDIPLYLQSGHFYRNLNPYDPDGVIEVPEHSFCMDGDNVTDIFEFSRLFRTSMFWKLDEVPQGLLRFEFVVPKEIIDISDWRTELEALKQAFETEFKKRDTANVIRMIHIKYKDIPLQLQAGEFYRSLDDGDPDCIVEVPESCFPANGGNVESVRELNRMISTSQFWMLDSIPIGIWRFCSERHKYDHFSFEDIHALDPNNHSVATTVHTAYMQGSLREAIRLNLWDVIMDTISRMNRDKYATFLAAGEGSLPVLRVLVEKGFTWHSDTCSEASSKGHLDCLMFAFENDCSWDSRVYISAAEKGHFHCVKYALEQDPNFRSGVCMYAALAGQRSCLECAFEQSCPWDESTIAGAARYGHLDCLQFMLEHGCPLDSRASIEACKHGHLECLKLLHRYGSPWNESTSSNAAFSISSACLRYLRENGCPWDIDTTQRSALQGRKHTLMFSLKERCDYDDNLMQYVVMGGSLECLRYFVEDELLFLNEMGFTMAVLKGDLSIVQYLIDQGCPHYFDPFQLCNIELCDTYFEPGNAEFVLCIERALDFGWVPCEHLMRYIFDRDFENCRELMEREQWYDRIPNLTLPIPLPSTVVLCDLPLVDEASEQMSAVYPVVDDPPSNDPVPNPSPSPSPTKSRYERAKNYFRSIFRK